MEETMKPEDQIKALAELDGWTPHDKYPDVMCRGRREAHIKSDNMQCYLTSYDAIIPLIQRQDDGVIGELHRFLWILWKKRFYEATPNQLCEALLRATNKWIEE